MQLFYTTNIREGQAIFDPEESQHISRSLRKQAGASIHWTDGAGKLYEGTLLAPDKQGMRARITREELQARPRPYQLTLAVAPTKQPDRIEWMLEKAVETGLDRLILLRSSRSEHHRLKTDRLERIALSAMKQSLQYYRCEIVPEMSLTEVLALPFDQKAIAHCNRPGLPFIQEVLTYQGRICILIGPEGDFSEEEVAAALAAAYAEISLGTNRLRTETAALFAAMHAYGQGQRL